MWWTYKPYVSVAQRQHNARKEVGKLQKSGRTISPVQLVGRKIAETFWGKAWCEHLESYSDYSNRLPRGRSYLRNGSVLDLQIEPGKISALVSGSEVYTITVNIKPLSKVKWNFIRQRLSGEIRSIIELLQGRMSDAVMAVVTDRDAGMFPAPDHIDMNCSCPDSAGLCKHLAAVLYGVGTRLDTQPELLFQLRQVNHLELVPTTATVKSMTSSDHAGRKTIADNELADVFGVEMDQPSEKAVAAETAPSAKPMKAAAKRMTKAKPIATAKPKAKATKRNTLKSVVATHAGTQQSSRTGKKQRSSTPNRQDKS